MYANKAIANQTFNMTGAKHSETSRANMRKGSNHRKFTQEEKDNLSRLNLNMASVFDIENKCYKRVSLILDKEKIDLGEYIFAGKLRNEASRKKSKDIMSDRFFCYDPVTNKQMFIKNDEPIPEGFMIGVPEFYAKNAIDRFTDDKFFYNSLTNEQIRSKIKPDGDEWKLGKINFGDKGNPFSNSVLGKDIRDGTNRKVQKDSNERVFIINRMTKCIISHKNVYSVSDDKFSNYLNDIGVIATVKDIGNFRRKYNIDEYLVFNGIKSIDITDYIYDAGHIWI